ncbi:MAG: hypothetical protein A3H44_05095 [Gammaproteobacteria bacterium RIFCSPLOWO2_02_FULL_57_10]|nr:MAG: hypothetical protein A3H44_05095 [Gammaproteobacteria bacterium RIFCSPLOWO2_02_FULL_57_10]
MSHTMKSYLFALPLSALVSACNTTHVDTARQFTVQDEQTALAMITESINNQCSAEGFVAGTSEHTRCFWQHASEVREQLVVVKENGLEYDHRMNGAAVLADRKFRAQDNHEVRIAQEQRQEQFARNDGG